MEPPQPDYAVRDILSMVYQAQGRELPTALSENFDPLIFTRIYDERQRHEEVVGEFVLPNADGVMNNVIDIDIEGSDWEFGSDRGSGGDIEEL